MGRAERVVFAFRALGEAGQAAALAQRPDAVAAAGDDLVRIGLVAHVPDQAVARRVENIVQGDGELDHAQSRPEVTARFGDGIDHLMPQLVSQLAQLARFQTTQLVWSADAIEQRGLGRLEHRVSSQAGVGQISESMAYTRC